MKYLLYIAIAILLLFVGRRSAQYVYNPISKKVEGIKAYNERGKHVVLFGDSHISYGAWISLLNRCDIASIGYGGYTASRLLQHVPGVLNYRPQVILLCVGVNDIVLGVPYNEYILNMNSLLTEVKKNNARVIVSHIMPVSTDYRYSSAINRQVDVFNAGLDSLAAHHKAEVIDINKYIAKNSYLSTEYTQPDNIHLNEAGYKVWAQEISDRL